MNIPKSESLILFAFFCCVALWGITKCSAKRSDMVHKVRDVDSDDLADERPVRQDTAIAATPQKHDPGEDNQLGENTAEEMPGPSTAADKSIAEKSTIGKPAGNKSIIDKLTGGKSDSGKPADKPTQYTSTLRKPGPDPKPAATASETTAKGVPQAEKSVTTLYATIDGLKVRKEPGLKGETIEQLALYAPVTFLNQKTEWTQEISLGYEKVTDHWVKIRTATGKTGWVFGAGVHFYKMKREGVIKETKPVEKTAKKKN